MPKHEIDDVHHEMLLAHAKRWRFKVKDLLEEMIRERYNSKKR